MAAVTPNALSGINNADAEKSKRGPGYTNVEDMIVARSFISASENAICGAHQKGKVFKAHMFEIYCKFIKEQMDRTRLCLNEAQRQHEMSMQGKELETCIQTAAVNQSTIDSKVQSHLRS
ncbi:hypothetical protein MHU86_21809 [Fragilaria crotonensis]|nr:hypothetical protein MHU86_21809 [Fragilaria crotonensis]